MRAILVNPKDHTITEVDYDGNYKSIYDLIDCRIFTAAITLENQDTLYLDDEGLLHGPTDFFKIEKYPDPLAGRCLIIGSNDEGESVDAKSDIDDLGIIFVFPMKYGDDILWLRT